MKEGTSCDDLSLHKLHVKGGSPGYKLKQRQLFAILLFVTDAAYIQGERYDHGGTQASHGLRISGKSNV